MLFEVGEEGVDRFLLVVSQCDHASTRASKAVLMASTISSPTTMDSSPFRRWNRSLAPRRPSDECSEWPGAGIDEDTSGVAPLVRDPSFSGIDGFREPTRAG